MKPTATPLFQIGICRSSSGVREAGCKSVSASRTSIVAVSILLRNRRWGTPNSSRSRKTSCSAGSLRSSASQTTMAASHGGEDVSRLMREFDRTGKIDESVALAHEIDGGDIGSRRSSDARALPGSRRRRSRPPRRRPAAEPRPYGPEWLREEWSCRFGRGRPARSAGSPSLSLRGKSASHPSYPPYVIGAIEPAPLNYGPTTFPEAQG